VLSRPVFRVPFRSLVRQFTLHRLVRLNRERFRLSTQLTDWSPLSAPGVGTPPSGPPSGPRDGWGTSPKLCPRNRAPPAAFAEQAQNRSSVGRARRKSRELLVPSVPGFRPDLVVEPALSPKNPISPWIIGLIVTPRFTTKPNENCLRFGVFWYPSLQTFSESTRAPGNPTETA